MGISTFIAMHRVEVQLGCVIGLAIGFVIVVIAVAWQFLGMKKEERTALIASISKDDEKVQIRKHEE